MLTEIILRWALPFLLGAAVSGITTFLRMKNKRDNALTDGVQCLLRAEIIACHERYGMDEYCPIYAKESLKRIYAAYHDLGGNDVATALYEQTLSLPDIRKDKES